MTTIRSLSITVKGAEYVLGKHIIRRQESNGKKGTDNKYSANAQLRFFSAVFYSVVHERV